jgi:hypothetical protein
MQESNNDPKNSCCCTNFIQSFQGKATQTKEISCVVHTVTSCHFDMPKKGLPAKNNLKLQNYLSLQIKAKFMSQSRKIYLK